jgi:DinB superfamily
MTSTKRECLEQMHASFAEFDAVLATVPRDRLTEPNAVGIWSIRDLLAHLAGYERYVAAEIVGTLTGQAPTNHDKYGRDDAPTAADDENDDTTNAWVVAWARRQTLDSILTGYTDAHDRLVRAVEACSDADLDEPGRFPWVGPERSLAEILPGQCWGHHREHRPDLERWRATLG